LVINVRNPEKGRISMNILFIVLGAALILWFAYRSYGVFLAKKVFQLDNTRKTPAVELEDGVDYVPVPARFLAGQHFSAIAAAGPITGPILAGILFGWVPALIWIIVGSIFIGGVLDIGSLIASIRHKAKSITEVVLQNVSRRAYILFMLFIWITLAYIIVAFTDLTAGSFVGVITLENGAKMPGGAIATASLLYLALPVIMGLFLRYLKTPLWLATMIFLPLVGVAIWAGQYIPLSLDAMLNIAPHDAAKIWAVFILGYCLIAAMLPMWMLLQPRGHLGGYFLYAALAAAGIGLVFGGFQVQYSAFTKPFDNMGAMFFPMFPILFVTVACGACSGFHCLVSSGTTSKQLCKESDAKPVGYGMMLLEGLVAVVSLACVMILAPGDPLVGKAPNLIYASGIGAFLKLIGIPPALGIAFGLMAFTTFVYDTLDVSTRLGRYIIEEITGWKRWFGKTVATALTAGVPLYFVMQTMLDAKGNAIPAWKVFWNIFGASNQLLAALALVGVTVWLLNSRPKSNVWMVPFFPAVWMFIMSNWALVRAVMDGWVWKTPGTNPAIPVVALVLISLSVLMAVETATAIFVRRGGAKTVRESSVSYR
jgi:carbon starvation protein